MSIPSESSRNIYGPPQNIGTRMVMIPSIPRPSNIFPINCPQGMNYQLNAPIPCRIIRYSTTAQYQQIMSAHGINTNLHGNEKNTRVKSKKKSLLTNHSKNAESKSTEELGNEDPLDLSSTNLSTFSSSSKTSISPPENQESNSEAPKSSKSLVLKSPKKEPITPPSSQSEPEEPEIESVPESHSALRKRKSPCYSGELLLERELEGWVGHVKPVPGIPRQAGSKREEVLKAAKSLFSKRTRTLYHWLYPSTSKNKLKATVAAAWETLSTAEKDFYISQVLGRFGVPAGSLMVNPQLGGFKGLAGGSGAGGSSSSSGSLEETGHPVTNMLLSEDDVAWTSYPQAQTHEPCARKRRRHARSTHGEGSSSRQNQEDEETLILKQMREESLEDDFGDDPELSKEFEQFRMFTQNIDARELNVNLNDILDGI